MAVTLLQIRAFVAVARTLIYSSTFMLYWSSPCSIDILRSWKPA